MPIFYTYINYVIKISNLIINRYYKAKNSLAPKYTLLRYRLHSYDGSVTAMRGLRYAYCNPIETENGKAMEKINSINNSKFKIRSLQLN